MDTLLFNTRDELLRVSLKHVVYFESDGNYTNIFFSNGTKATLLYSLSNMELQINEKLTGMPQPFIRIGRQYIVNSSYIFQNQYPETAINPKLLRRPLAIHPFSVKRSLKKVERSVYPEEITTLS